MKKLWENYKTFMVEVVLRKVLIPVMLGFAYFIGVGLSSLLARIFMGSTLRGIPSDSKTFWVSVKDNEADPAKTLRQS